jgi:hypothetical protein
MFNLGMFKNTLEIATDLSEVVYDECTYEVAKVIRIPKEVNYKCHICADKRKYSVKFDQIVDIKNKTYFVSFCNKCKKLFLKRK